MSAEMASSTSGVTIYVLLINEGTSVVRPTQGVRLCEKCTGSFQHRTMIQATKNGRFLLALLSNANLRHVAARRSSWRRNERRSRKRISRSLTRTFVSRASPPC
jgi:hypothetical protein